MIDEWERFKSILMNIVNTISAKKEVRSKQRTEHGLMQEFCSQLMIETELLKRSKVTNLNKTFLILRIYEIKIRL